MIYKILLLLFISAGCTAQPRFPKLGSVERYDSAINEIIAAGASAEIIATGFDWSEGPLWVDKYQMLLFSDVPRNSIYKWTEANGIERYLTPSGYTNKITRGGETGSNGLLQDRKGRLVLCQHGDRRMAAMQAPINKPQPKFVAIGNQWNGKRFNSPNDAVYNSKGSLFFTDPPYGLEKGMNDSTKEIPFQGVYVISKTKAVSLITDTLTRPNGIAFLPGEKQFIVANSDSKKPNWYIYDIDKNNAVSNGRIFYSAAGSDKSLKGGLDGLKVDKNGNIFATGPGGLWIFNSTGKLLGKLLLSEAASNCALSADEKTLYITNDMQILRFKMR